MPWNSLVLVLVQVRGLAGSVAESTRSCSGHLVPVRSVEVWVELDAIGRAPSSVCRWGRIGCTHASSLVTLARATLATTSASWSRPCLSHRSRRGALESIHSASDLTQSSTGQISQRTSAHAECGDASSSPPRPGFRWLRIGEYETLQG